jgi:ABC-2 type transport system permease protein
MRQRLRAIWDSRELLTYLVTADIKIKYKGTALGVMWSMVAPALSIGVYFLVFQVILKNGVPDYVVMLWAGMLVWTFFSAVVVNGTGIVVQRAGIVKKVAFPREILALSTVGTALVYFFLQFIVLGLLMAVLGHAPAWGDFWLLPLAFLGLLLLASALGILLSAVNVYFRDMQHLVEVGIFLWFWLTPVVYSFERTVAPMLGARDLTWIYFLNPITPVVLTFQRVLYGDTVVTATTPDHAMLNVLPNWSALHYALLNGVLIAVSGAALVVAIRIFGRLQGNFAEEL